MISGMLLFGCLLPSRAADPAVTVEDRSGNTTQVLKAEVQRINLNQGTVEIIRRNGERITFDRATIRRILTSDYLAVDEVEQSSVSVEPRMTTDIVRVEGLAEAAPYYLFDIGGQLRLAGTCTPDGAELSLGSFPSGLYLLVVGDETFKIIKK